MLPNENPYSLLNNLIEQFDIDDRNKVYELYNNLVGMFIDCPDHFPVALGLIGSQMDLGIPILEKELA